MGRQLLTVPLYSPATPVLAPETGMKGRSRILGHGVQSDNVPDGDIATHYWH